MKICILIYMCFILHVLLLRLTFYDGIVIIMYMYLNISFCAIHIFFILFISILEKAFLELYITYFHLNKILNFIRQNEYHFNTI